MSPSGIALADAAEVCRREPRLAHVAPPGSGEVDHVVHARVEYDESRTAVVRGVELGPDDDEAFELVMAVAAGEVSDVGEIVAVVASWQLPPTPT
jgi:hypothetical protein